MGINDNEKISEYFTRANTLVNKMATNGEIIETQRVVEIFLRSLPRIFDHVVVAIEESHYLSTMALESFQGRLETHETKILQRSPQYSHDQALKSQFTGGRGYQCGRERGQGRGRGGRNSYNQYGQTKRNEELKEDEKHFFNNSPKGRGRGAYKCTKPNIECYHCHKSGHKINDFWEKYPKQG